MGADKPRKQHENPDFDLPITDKPNVNETSIKKLPTADKENHDKKEFMQIKKNFLFSLLVFSFFFAIVVVLYIADLKSGIVNDLLTKLGLLKR